MKQNGNASIEEMDVESGEKKPCITLRKLLTKSQQVNGTTAVPSDMKVGLHCVHGAAQLRPAVNVIHGNSTN